MIQVLANSIIYASMIAIIAVGISLSYSILRFANFAHIQYAVVGGYATYVGTRLGLPLVAARSRRARSSSASSPSSSTSWSSAASAPSRRRAR